MGLFSPSPRDVTVLAQRILGGDEVAAEVRRHTGLSLVEAKHAVDRL